jgi:hypothetical protein
MAASERGRAHEEVTRLCLTSSLTLLNFIKILLLPDFAATQCVESHRPGRGNHWLFASEQISSLITNALHTEFYYDMSLSLCMRAQQVSSKPAITAYAGLLSEGARIQFHH